MIAIWPLAESTSTFGRKHGETRSCAALAAAPRPARMIADDAADRRADEDPDPAGSTPSTPASAHASRAAATASSDVPLEPARLLRPDDRLRLEALDLGGDPHREARSRRTPGCSRRRSARRRAASQVDCASSPSGRDGSETGDDDAPHEAGERSSFRPWPGRACGRSRAGRAARPTCTRRSRSRRWRPSSSASSRRATAGSTSRSGTASAACSRTAAASSRLWSRNARPLLRYFPELRPLGELLPPHSALDGEIVIERDGVLDFDAMQMRLHPAESRVNKLSAEIPARFIAFDVLVWKGVEAWHEPLVEAPDAARAEREALRALARDARPRRGARLARRASRRSGSTA